MKINNNLGPNLQGLDATKNKKMNDSSDKALSSLDSRGDVKTGAQVNLSDKAQLMQKAKEIASRTDDIDEAKVARLQKLIDEGKYSVDAKAVADRLVDDHLLYPGE